MYLTFYISAYATDSNDTIYLKLPYTEYTLPFLKLGGTLWTMKTSHAAVYNLTFLDSYFFRHGFKKYKIRIQFVLSYSIYYKTYDKRLEIIEASWWREGISESSEKLRPLFTAYCEVKRIHVNETYTLTIVNYPKLEAWVKIRIPHFLWTSIKRNFSILYTSNTGYSRSFS